MSESKPKRRAGFDDLDMTDIAATPMRRRTDNLPWALEQIQQQASVISAHALRLNDHDDKLSEHNERLKWLRDESSSLRRDVKTLQDAVDIIGPQVSAMNGKLEDLPIIRKMLENLERTAPRTSVPPMAPPMIYAPRDDTLQQMREDFKEKRAFKKVLGQIIEAATWFMARKKILALFGAAVAVWIYNLSLATHDKVLALWQVLTGK